MQTSVHPLGNAAGPALWCVVACLAVAGPVEATPLFVGAAARGEIAPSEVVAIDESLAKSLLKVGARVVKAPKRKTKDRSGGPAEIAQSAFAEAKQLVKDDEPEAALLSTDDALEAFEKSLAFGEDEAGWQLFRALCLLRAELLFEMKLNEEAEYTLARLVAVRPDLRSEKGEASEKVLRKLSEVKEQLRSGSRASLIVQSKPAGANVLMDGKRVGRTPLSLDDIVVGPHFIVIEKSGARHTERVVLGRRPVVVKARLEGAADGNATLAAAVVKELGRGTTARKLVDASFAVDDDVIVAVVVPRGRDAEILVARIVEEQVRAVFGVRTKLTANDRDRATYMLAQALVDKEQDAWLDKDAKDDPSGLRQALYTSVGDATVVEPVDVPPALWFVAGGAGLAVVAAVGAGVGVFLVRDAERDRGFTFAVDTSDLR